MSKSFQPIGARPSTALSAAAPEKQWLSHVKGFYDQGLFPTKAWRARNTLVNPSQLAGDAAALYRQREGDGGLVKLTVSAAQVGGRLTYAVTAFTEDNALITVFDARFKKLASGTYDDEGGGAQKYVWK